MKTKNKRIQIKKTLKKRGGGAKFSTVKQPKKNSPSPPPIKIKKVRFRENPVSDEWDQSPRSPSEFYYPEQKKPAPRTRESKQRDRARARWGYLSFTVFFNPLSTALAVALSCVFGVRLSTKCEEEPIHHVLTQQQ